jgi:hypothetical protein
MEWRGVSGLAVLRRENHKGVFGVSDSEVGDRKASKLRLLYPPVYAATIYARALSLPSIRSTTGSAAAAAVFPRTN